MAGSMALISVQRSNLMSSGSRASPASATRAGRPFGTVPLRVNHKFATRVQAAQDGDLELPSNLPEPDTARAAIALGLKLTEAKKWEDAQTYFEKALELPGTGLKRFRDKPNGLSDGERIAIMYNIACCQSQIGEEENVQNGLIAIAGCLEKGKKNEKNGHIAGAN